MQCSIDPNRSTGHSVFLAALLLTSILSGLSSARADWNLVWRDEFNGTALTLDTNYWSFDLGNCQGWGNNELEYYTGSTNNAYVAGGALHIAALKQATNGFAYTSARVVSSGVNFCTDLDNVGFGSYSFVYGRLEFRVKLPVGAGLWPAIWLLPENNRNSRYGVWPQYGEVDIVENNGTQGYNKGNLFYTGGNQNIYTAVNDINQWHTYALEWSTNQFAWLLDGVVYGKATNWSAPTGFSFPAPYDTNFFIIMNVAVGGDYTDSDTNHINGNLPAEMLVDYVRLYQQTAPLAISAKQTNGNLILTWPTKIVCRLQSETNLARLSNWSDVPGAKSPLSLSPSNGPVWFRLVSP
jgi:beta-glucanase (GH16 family)